MFYGFVITENGNEMLAKMVAGQTLELSKVVMDKGTAESAEAARKLTAPITMGPEGTSTAPTANKNTINMIVEYRSDLNGGLAEGFWIGGFGVYAKDPSTKADTMIYYGSLGDAKQYVSAYTPETAPDVRRYPVAITVTEGVGATVTYPADAWMSAQDVANYFNATLKPELEISLGGLVETHNTDPSAHGGIRQDIAQNTATIAEVSTVATKAQNTATINATAIAEVSTAVAKAQETANAAMDAVKQIVNTIAAVPTQSGSLIYTGSAQRPTWNGYNPAQLTVGGVTEGVDAGTYSATFTPKENYAWTDGSTTAKTAEWKIGRATIQTVPAQSGNLTYNGTVQSPTWSDYNSAQATVGGESSGINAGTYTATFTPTKNYAWGNGNTAAKMIDWIIRTAEGGLSLDKTSITLTNAENKAEIIASRLGDGAVTAISDNACATVSVLGNVVTVTGRSYGTAAITVSVGKGTNYTAPASKTCHADIKFYNTRLESNSWEAIKEASDANLAASIWSIGDTKNIQLNGKMGNKAYNDATVSPFIIGFNHNASLEGGNKIHFMIGKAQQNHTVALTDSNYGTSTTGNGYFQMNTANTNTGGWNGSYMRKTLLGNSSTPESPMAGSLMACLPPELRKIMKPCTKYTDNVGGGTGTPANITATTDYLFLLSEFEYHGVQKYSDSAETPKQTQYDYYKAGNSKIHYKQADQVTPVIAWCRSVHVSSTTGFCIVVTDGGASNYGADISLGASPGFCV